jgi:hypothetical protein
MVAVEALLLIQAHLVRRAELTVLHPGAAEKRLSRALEHVARRALRTVARTGLKPVSSLREGYALRSPLFERMGDERTLPLALKNG